MVSDGSTRESLPPPVPLYEPWRGGRYDVRPGLHAFGRDFGAGALDRCVFQFAADAPALIAARRAKAARERDAVSLRHDLDDATRDAAAASMRHRIAVDLSLLQLVAATQRVAVGTSSARVRLRPVGSQLPVAGAESADVLRALGDTVPEDFAVIRFDRETGRDWVAAMEVCLPAGWSPREKIGRPFDALHASVPGMEATRARAATYVRVMCDAADGLVRFGWGLQFDDDLDHTPGRSWPGFDAASPRVFARVERQTIWGLRGGAAALFTIRTYLYDVAAMTPDSRRDLAAAIESMSPESRAYKGLPADVGALAAFVRAV